MIGERMWSELARRVLRFALAAILAFAMCPVVAFATAGEAFADTVLVAASVDNTTVVASGTYYGYGSTSGRQLSATCKAKYSWKLYESGLLSIDLTDIYYYSYSGYSGFEHQSPGWRDYANQITRIDMSASYEYYYGTATSNRERNSPSCYQSVITSYMFQDLPNLTTVNAPYVRMVGPDTFKGCSNLQSATIGTLYRYADADKTDERNDICIWSSAFEDCTSLSEVTIGGEYTHGIHFDNYGSGAYSSSFEGCTSLTSVNLTSYTGSVGHRTFAGCTALRNIDISTMDHGGIGTAAFEGCTRLREIELPEGITSLPDNVFKGDTSLKSVTLPSTLASIGSGTFRDCTALSDVILPDNLTSIGSNAFDGCTALEEANLGPAITSLGISAYANSGLKSVTVPGSVSAIIPSAFENCDALKAVYVESGTKSLGASSFAGCDALEEVRLADTVTVVAANAFAGCPKLAKVWFQGDAPTIAANSFDGVTATALYPIDSEYWEEADMADYGGTLTWTPCGDISACELSADDLVYSGAVQEPATHLRAANGMEVDPGLYAVSYFSDFGCVTPIDAKDVKPCGTYYLKATGRDDCGCTGAVGPATFQMKKAPLTVSYVSETVEKDETPAYKIAYNGFVADEGESSLTTLASLPTPSTLQPGHSYTLTPEGAEAESYEMTYEPGTLVVNPIPIAKPACADGLVYSGLDQVAVEPGVGYTLSGTTHAANAGAYEATIKLEDGYAWADGSLEDLTYTWSIGKAPLTASFVDETIGANAAPALKVSVTGFVNGETAGSAAGYRAPAVSVNPDMKPGYSYTATVSGGAADNYSFTYESGRVTMNRAVVEPPEATLSFTYDGSQKTAVAAGEEYDLSGVWAATDAGSYSAIATLKDGYEWSDGTTAAKKFTWAIAPASGVLSLDESSLSLKIAETTSVGISYTGDGTVIATSSDESVAMASVEAGKVRVDAVGEGTARIVVSSSGCSNYTTPAPVTLTVTVESVDLSQCSLSVSGGTYTGMTFDPRPMVALPGGAELAVASSHVVRYYSDSACTKEVAAGDLKAAGPYWARAEAVAGGRSSGVTEAVPFQIEKAVLDAVYEGEAVEFGGSPQASVEVTGFVGGETAATASGYAAPTVQVPSTLERATEYTLVPAGGAADNYAFAYKGGKLSVGKMVVERPAAATGLTYTGSPQTGVSAASGYELAGTATATDKGSYTATATLDEGCVWSDGTSSDIEIDWEITAADIALASAEAIADRQYTGADIEPRPQLALGALPLVLGKDYTLRYSSNRDAGTAAISVSGTGNFAGSKAMTFKISPVDLSGADVSGVEASYAYTGKSIAPEPIVVCNGSTLAKGVDYTVSFADNLSAGTATLTIAGKGNYVGSLPVSFSIRKTSIEDAAITGVIDKVYTGEPVAQQAKVSLDGVQLVEGDDYLVSYENNTDAGTASVTFTGLGGYAGSKTVRFFISPASIAQASIEGVEASYVYTGAPIRPVSGVKLGAVGLVEGVDYSISYADNVDVGTATARIDGIGNYTGTATASFAIAKARYDFSGVSFSGATVAYDGAPHSLAVSGDLPAGVKVSYDGNGASSAGDHTVTATFTGDGNHEAIGSMSAVLTIEKASVPVPSAASGLVYNGKTQTGVGGGDLYTVAGGSASAAGDYTATASLRDADNYQWTGGSSADQTVSWSIGRARLVASYAGERITYGDDPALVVSVAGFVGGETAASAAGYAAPTVRAGAASAGTYRLVPAGGAADNYEFSYAGGDLVIGKAPVMVVADSAFKVYGAADPSLTYRVLGAPEGEVGGYVSISRAPGEDAGEYAVSVSASDSPNYEISVLGSRFTIEKADYDMSGVSFPDGVFTYDGDMHSLQVEGALPGGVSVSYSGNGKSAAGSYGVTAAFGGDANHNPVENMEATLTIRKATVAPPEVTREIPYTGSEVTAVRAGDGFTVVGGSATDVGDYKAVAMLDDPENHEWKDGPGALREFNWSIVGGDEPSPSPASRDMHRLYNRYTGEHFYTASEAERDDLVKVGWSYEGVGWNAPVKSGTPVYRLYNRYVPGGDHHYTTDASERDRLVKVGWNDEGVGWYSADAEGVPLYRQYNPYAETGTHNYTADKAENDKLVSLGWRAEGIGWYGMRGR